LLISALLIKIKMKMNLKAAIDEANVKRMKVKAKLICLRKWTSQFVNKDRQSPHQLMLKTFCKTNKTRIQISLSASDYQYFSI